MIFRPRSVFGFALVCLLGFLETVTRAAAPAIELHALSRVGGQAGSEFDLHILSGVKIEEINRITFSHPNISATFIPPPPPPPEAKEGTPPAKGMFRVRVDGNVPAGLYEVSGEGRWGISNRRLFWITESSWRVAEPDAATLESPLPLAAREIVQGNCRPRGRHAFQLELQAGESASIRVRTATIDSRARIVATILDSSRRTVATSDSIDHRDTEFVFSARATGTYTLILHDHLFRGGHDYPFAVTWDRLEGSPTPDDLVARWRNIVQHLEEKERPGGWPTAPDVISVRGLTLRPPVDAPLTQHQEATYPNPKPCPLPLPGIAVGSFEGSRDEDWFEFALQQGKPVAFEVISERVGERSDPQLILFRVESTEGNNENLHRESLNDDLSTASTPDIPLTTRDPLVVHTPSKTGTYRLLVRDLQRAGGKEQRRAYALEARFANHDFRIIANFANPVRDLSQSKPIAPTVGRQETWAIGVRVHRFDGWNGPVTLTLDPLPEGLSTAGLTLGPNLTTGRFILATATEAPPFRDRLHFFGKGAIDGTEVKRPAHATEVNWGPIDTFRAPTARSIQDFKVSIEERQTFPLVAQWKGESPVTLPRGGEVKVGLTVTRGERAKQPLTLRLQDLPSQVTANEVKLNPDQQEAEFIIKAGAGAVVGEYWPWAHGETKIKTEETPPQDLDVQFPSLSLPLRIVEK